MSETKVKCADLVQGNYERECKQLNDMVSWGENEEEWDDSIHDYGLSFSWMPAAEPGEPGYFCWLLSWGGPQDEFRFFVDGDLDLYKAEYWYLDWGDGAEVEVPIDDEHRPEWLTYMWNMWEDTGTLKQLIEREKVE